MKKLDGVGKEHEEFKLTLDKDLQVDLKQIDIHKDIAAEQAKVLGEALKSAKIDIVGGESEFFDTIIHAITKGKQVDRLVNNSDHLRPGSGDSLLAEGDGQPARPHRRVRRPVPRRQRGHQEPLHRRPDRPR